MSRLPVIVGFGGYNAAGRSSFHHAFCRTVLESLDEQARQQTLAGLAVMMKLVKFEDGHYLDAADGARLDLAAIERRHAAQILGSTLIRRIEKQYFDVDAAHWHKNLTLEADGAQPLSFTTARKQLPEPLPANWSVEELADNQVRVTLHDSVEVKVDSYREMPVKSAGQLPTGFEPGELYASRFHPRGLQMAVVGATDAIRSVGIDWQRIVDRVQPDEIAVFSSSIMSQLDDNGFGGLLQSRLKGHRVSAKQLPLGFNSMPTDFINAYVLGSVGLTGSVTGACATFLYNLQKGIEAITSGQARVVVVGNSEAPITSEIVEGYAAMSALATEEGLRNIEGRPDVDFRRASRPFGENCGFTLAESSQYVVLMDDALALELGADIHGAVTDVFINADGFKKSISAPGPGNYLTMAKAVAAAMQIVGEEGVRRHSFVHAHGSSTPANRVTESEILDRVAKAFGIADWPVAAVKAFVGHSLATASADQLVSALGTFKYGLLPGIKTVETFADDVHKDRIALSNKDRRRDDLDVCFINSKGFGGNNATGVLLSPRLAEKMLRKRHGAAAFDAYQARREQTRAAAQRYEEQALKGQFDIIYNFGNDMIDDRDIRISAEEMSVPGFAQPLVYKKDERFSDMLD
ncbi:acetoacetyl-[acyl-carrier protein] synthase [Pseudomonas citronellolis]|uniref:beta-ketoacyl synthase n=1 Tax=Pseudomonas citronellolis TaxID=53408 RepID=UPI0020A01F49|nr:beta-ketoacyl synthase [Pseudomonas citronellolis]MCP1645203.1 acetoacetyl-[acyl-carrier protein] synthase [Pseudomonas citronellolis]MCP1665158.1 acetoacetyl-[acyl-carrier protein] synthase [Pseudomonas citronellolis]MCP1698591.1 acetoacetyl-[acyl-carrier protein] synthase [Pseudomonas citronellolis]MCP1703688.1 acetoacetyl-[acyl-carrier protein] synthase [Pseudomonas citronellolis]MCP1799810.1 acetoacetyl-[acyl-carrier protein] synthase [Pseudomonas citronellolis]